MAKRDMFMGHPIEGVMKPFIAPPGFAELTYEIKSDLLVPITRKNQYPADFTQNNKNTNYQFPIHKPHTNTYNLLCTLDKMKVGDYITVPDKDCYYYALVNAGLYATKIRADKKANMQFRFRGSYDAAHNLGRIWRIS